MKTKTIVKTLSVLPLWLVLLTQIGYTGLAMAAPNIPSSIPLRKLEHGTSSNWSGYAVYDAPGTFNNVSASWVQPAVTCTAIDAYSSYWVGLDGYSSGTVEQLGTEADCINGQARYYAWYEMYPHYAYYAGVSVKPGDSLNATVTYQSPSRNNFFRGNYFTLKIANLTTNRSFSTTQRLSGTQRSSAEVIVEAPWSGTTLPLANYGTANFTASTANGLPMGNFAKIDPLTMINPSGAKSTPGAFDISKLSFSTTWSAQ